MKYLAVFWIKDDEENWGFANTDVDGPQKVKIEHVRQWEREAAEASEMKIAILVGLTRL